jgi:hypothetical protein
LLAKFFFLLYYRAVTVHQLALQVFDIAGNLLDAVSVVAKGILASCQVLLLPLFVKGPPPCLYHNCFV